MTTANVKNAVVKGLKIVGSCIATAAIVETGFLGGKMLINDGEYVGKTIKQKVRPVVKKKRHFWSKPEDFDVRAGKFVADKKKAAKKSKR